MEEINDLRGSSLVQYITSLFEAFKSARKPWEEMWIELWHNFLGEYQESTVWRKKTEGKGGRSRAFVKLTALKCHTAHSKIIDVLFPGKGEVPFDMIPLFYRELGLDIEKARSIVADAKERLREHFRDIEFEETCDTAILEMCILGTAVLKGPIVEMRSREVIRPRMVGGVPLSNISNENALTRAYEMTIVEEPVPVIDYIPLWEYYTDINAKSNKDAIGEIHFQRLLPEQFRRLANVPGYIKENVLEAARRATSDDPNDMKYVQLGDNYMGVQGEKDKRVSVLEYWGLVPLRMLIEAGAEIPEDLEVDSPDADVEALVVLAADGIVCKATVNPLKERVFWVCPYKKRPGVIYGTGVAEMMRDSQKIINSAVRLLIDNKALSGPGMVGINLDRINTKKTRDLDIYPGKTWYIRGNFSPREAIDTVKFNDVSQDILQLIQTFERFADEETGLPKYTSGEQDSFLNKTATGMSMLMAQANINLKTVLKNIDNCWIEPIVEAFHKWFADFVPGYAPIPIKIKAMGAESLIAKELKLENYMRFMQATASPQDAIFMDRTKLIKNIARILDTEDVLRTEEEMQALMNELTNQAKARKDMREMVDIDRLYPLLTRAEQIQVLEQLGIVPDINQREAVTDPKYKGLIEKLKTVQKGEIYGAGEIPARAALQAGNGIAQR